MSLRDLSKLDLAFALDTTSSMASYIENAKTNIKEIADQIKQSEKCDLKLALVNYRDHPPQDRTYITQVHDLNDDIEKVKNWIKNTYAGGGGDGPESVCCALNDCLEKLSWRDDAVKIVILIADAPPHGLGSEYDGFPKGCPDKVDPVEVAHKMAKKGITLYCVGCEPSITPYMQFFIALCLITGGQYVPLDSANKLSNVIIGGAREEMSMEKMMADAHNEYMKEVAEKGGRVDEDELTKRIHSVINKNNDSVAGLKDHIVNIQISDSVKEISKAENLADLLTKASELKVSLHGKVITPLFSSYKSPSTVFSSTTFPPIPLPYFKKVTVTRVKKINKRRLTTPVKRTTRVKRLMNKTKKPTSTIGLRRSLRLIEKNKKREAEPKTTSNCLKRSIKCVDESSTATKNVKKIKTTDEKITETKVENVIKTENQIIDITKARRLAKRAIARNRS